MPFRAVLVAGLVLGCLGLGTAAYLSARVLIPFASACLQACASNPVLMSLARGGAGLGVAVVASGGVVGLLALGNQLLATRRLIAQVESKRANPPAKLARIAGDLGLVPRLTYVADPAVYAFCYGFRSPRICVSSGMVESFTARELRAVLLHESYHMEHRDPVKVLASRMVAAALFLLPVVSDLKDRYLVEKELAADARVVGTLTAAPLAEALLKICRGRGQRPVAALAAAAVGPFNVVGERIRHLADPSRGRPPLRASRVAASLAVVAAVMLASVGSTFAAERGAPAGPTCCVSPVVCDTGGR